jgi:hypothetical protein
LTVTSANATPNAPSNLSLVAVLAGDPGQAVVAIQWQRNSTDEDGFLIQRSTGGAFTDVGGTNKAQVYFEDVVNGAEDTTYQYRIVAFNEFGNSSPSNTISVCSIDKERRNKHDTELH